MGVVFATAVAIAAVGISVLPGGVAGAVPRAAVTSDGDFCAYNGVTDLIACVDDPADIALAYAATEAAQEGARSAQAAAGVVLGRFFDDLNYGTSSGFIDYLGAAACTPALSPRDVGWASLGVWANRISSFQGFNSCYIRLWTGTTYAGTPLSYRTLSADVGTTLNNNSESIEFS